MNIVLLCGNNPNHVALANKVANQFNLTGIVIEERKRKKKSLRFSIVVERVLDRTFFRPIRKAWLGTLQHYESLWPSFPEIVQKKVESINSSETIAFIQKLVPDLIIVSGTSIIRKKILGLHLSRGMINLHTGLSPYVKGGPNCTNWCIANKEYHLIGNTIMWIDAGIDSGNIITTEQTILDGSETLTEVHVKVMEHAHELYCKAIRKIETDFENCPNVKQDLIAEGTTYYSKEWNWKSKFSLIINFKKKKKYLNSAQYKVDLQIPTTVSL